MTEPIKQIAKLKKAGEERAEQFVRFCSATRAYAGANRSEPAFSDLLAILQRHTVVWETTESTSPSGAPGFGKILTGPESLGIVRPLLTQPFFYRMNFIKQLSTTHLWQHLEASHSRLAHSLGVAEAAEYFLNSIARNYPTEFRDRDHERVAVIVYAFIHDCFHGPLGHSLELLRGVFYPTQAGRLDKFFLREAVDNPNSSLNRALSSIKHPHWDKIIELLKFLASPRQPRPKFPDRYFLTQIVDSTFDADRIDYICRDARHLDKPLAIDERQLEEVLNEVRILKIKNQVGVEVRSLAFPLHQQERIETFLRHRAELYAEYYEHPTKMIADDMICHAIYYAIENAAFLTPGGAETPLSQKTTDLVKGLSRLTDDGLFHFLIECGRLLFSQLLVRDIMTNDLFQVVFQESITFSEVKEVQQKAAQLKEDYDGKIRSRKKELGIPPFTDLPREYSAPIFREVWQRPGARKAVTLDFLWLLSRSGFGGRHTLEKTLWGRILRDGAIQEEVLNCYFDKFGDAHAREEIQRIWGADAFENLLKYPHVHISAPSFVGGSERDLLAYAKETTTERLLFYDGEEGPVLAELDIAPKGNKAAGYVLVSAPRFLTSSPMVKNAIAREFNTLLGSGDWAVESWLSGVVEAG